MARRAGTRRCSPYSSSSVSDRLPAPSSPPTIRPTLRQQRRRYTRRVTAAGAARGAARSALQAAFHFGLRVAITLHGPRTRRPEATMTLKNATGRIRVLTLFGLVLAVACESDVTSLGRKSKPEFVLLTPGTVSQVSAGGYHSCALRTDGTVACWGLNRYGQATAPAGVFT